MTEQVVLSTAWGLRFNFNLGVNMKEKIRPFSKGSDFMFWSLDNCHKCEKANFETDDRTKTCPMEYDLAFASVTDGLIPKESAERIGLKTEPYIHLTDCKEFKNQKQSGS